MQRRDTLLANLHSNPKAKFVTRVLQFGSEPLFDNVLSHQELAEQVELAKANLSSLSIPVTVSELAYGYASRFYFKLPFIIQLMVSISFKGIKNAAVLRMYSTPSTQSIYICSLFSHKTLLQVMRSHSIYGGLSISDEQIIFIKPTNPGRLS